MDKECEKLCGAMNECPGITTFESCWGHFKEPYRIFFQAESLEDLAIICYCVAACHCGYPGWSVIVRTDCAMSPVTFIVQGPPVGEEVFRAVESEEIARVIREHLETGKGQ